MDVLEIGFRPSCMQHPLVSCFQRQYARDDRPTIFSFFSHFLFQFVPIPVLTYESKAAVCSIASQFSFSVLSRRGIPFLWPLCALFANTDCELTPHPHPHTSRTPSAVRMQLCTPFVSHSSYIRFAIRNELVFCFVCSSLVRCFLFIFIPFQSSVIYLYLTYSIRAFAMRHIHHFLGHNSVSLYLGICFSVSTNEIAFTSAANEYRAIVQSEKWKRNQVDAILYS